MNGLFIAAALALVAIASVEGTFGTVLRGYGLNGQYYTGSGVGPLWMFRSSADNAATVNEGLKGHPIQRAIALALGDEFPRLRDDLIQRAKAGSRYGSGGSEDAEETVDADKDGATAGGYTASSSSSSSSSASAPSGRQSPLSAFTNFQNWRYDRENSKNEFNNPYRRPNPISSVVGLVGSLGSRVGGGSGSGGGILSSVTGLVSSFVGGGGSSSSSSSSSGSSSGSGGFRISVDTPTRSPNSI